MTIEQDPDDTSAPSVEDWRDDIPTTPDHALAPAPSDITVARCRDCGREVMRAGPYPPSDADGARFASPERCLRGAQWSWCASQGRLSRWSEPTP